MKTRWLKQFSLCLFVVLMGLCLPTSGKAEGAIALSSFEELKEVCSDTSKATASFLFTSDEMVITDDIEIPAGFVITFRNFTVPEGITMTVLEGTEIRTYGFTVSGHLINRGKIVQQDLAAEWADDDIEIAAHIPGHVENKGEMILTDVYGTRNINRFGGKLVMYETESYRERLKIAAGYEDPTPTVEAVNTPSPTQAPVENGTVHRVFDILEDVIPKLAFFLVLACFFSVVRIGIATSHKEKRRKQGSGFTEGAEDQFIRNNPDRETASDLLYNFPGEDHFQRDKRKRIEQLDDWLKNGLIDRSEYNELKRRYREDR